MKELGKTNPEIKVSRYNIATQYKEIKKFKIKTIPTLIIGDIMLGGWIKEEEFRAVLEKL